MRSGFQAPVQRAKAAKTKAELAAESTVGGPSSLDPESPSHTSRLPFSCAQDGTKRPDEDGDAEARVYLEGPWGAQNPPWDSCGQWNETR